MNVIASLSRLCSRTDEEAMWQVKTRDDHHEFARLVDRWEKPIHHLCTRMTGDPHRGEDLKQDAFLRLFEKRKDYQPTGRFSTFLWRIALNLCYDELRRQQRRREFLIGSAAEDAEGVPPESPADGPGPDLRAAALEEGELVRQAVMQLPEIYRAVIVLRHYQDLKLTRIAEILQIPEGTVNSRMAEALSRLSRILEPKLKDQSGSPPPHDPVAVNAYHKAPDDAARAELCKLTT
ncbi:MAG TPA: sigma-70 family RNA polymerase sigma factor [Candidatus Acidoferrum sp.]|jgi:RNA polymerase sigma-70 factor (ECF subfamily)|nr:sigma-70 family RNA polymerase sigma factor [Candidatus Acidoferrum sp.]